MSNNALKSGFSSRYQVSNGSDFKLKDYQTTPKQKVEKAVAKNFLAEQVQVLSDLQNVLYADDKYSVLLIFQAMDAAGKDSAIKNLLSGVNPQGCEVYSFKRPTSDDLEHDYMWRSTKNLPSRGCIGVFNRSYYEETLIVRVHQAILNKQKIPKDLISKNIWRERFEYIRSFEKHLAQNGTIVLKFFLHLSLDEQKKRLIERIENPEKNWKFDPNDLYERQFWSEYMTAYEQTIQATACQHAPWFVIPADNQHYARAAIADAVCLAMKKLNLQYPTLSDEVQENLRQYKEQLENERTSC